MLRRFFVFGSSILFCLALQDSPALAAAITSTPGGGNWILTATWVGGVVPGAGDDVTIARGSTVTVTDSRAANSVTFANISGLPATLDINGGSLTVGAGNLSIPAVIPNTDLVKIGGSPSSLTVITISGNLSSPANAQLTFTGNGTLNITGDMPSSAAVTLSAGTGTVNFNGTGAQNVGGQTYNNVTINKSSGLASVVGAPVVNGNLTLTAGNLDVTSTNSITVGNNLALSAGTIITSSGGSGSVTLNGSGATLTGPASGTGTITPPTTFAAGTRSITGNVTFSSALTITGSVTNNGNVISQDTSTGLDGAGTWTQGTNSNLHVVSFGIMFSGTLVAAASGNLVDYASVSTTVRSATYYDLSISGGCSASVGSGGITVSDNLTIGAGSTLSDLGSQINPATTGNLLTLGAGARLGLGYACSGVPGTGMPSFTTYSLDPTSTVAYQAGGIQTISALGSPMTYGNLELSANSSCLVALAKPRTLPVRPLSSGTVKTAGGNITITGNLTVMSGLPGASFNVNGLTTTVGGSVNGGGEIDMTSGGNLVIAGDNLSGGSFIAGSGTVTHNGGGTHTVRGTAYNNLVINNSAGTFNLSGPGTAVNLTVSAGVFNIGSNTFGVSNNLTVNGKIDTPVIGSGILQLTAPAGGTLAGNGEIAPTLQVLANKTFNASSPMSIGVNGPGAGVDIAAGATVTNNGFVYVYAVTGADNTSTWINAAGSTLQALGDILPATGTLNATATNNTVIYGNAGPNIVKGTTYYNLTITTASSATMQSGVVINGNFDISGASSTTFIEPMTIGGNVSISNTSALTLGAFTHTVKGNWTTASTATVTPTGSTVQFSGLAAQTIANFAGSSFADVTFSNSAGATIASSGNSFFASGKVTISGGATLTAGSGFVNVGGDWTRTGTFNPGTSLVTFNGGGAQNISGSNFNTVAFSNAGTKTALGAFAVAGNLTITSSATFAAGSFTHTVGGNWTNSATFTPGTSTITLNGSGAQAVSATPFNNLTINKSAGTATVNTSTTVAGTLTLTAGTLALTGGGNLTAPSFTQSGGTLSMASPNMLTVNNTLNWSGGTMTGTGQTILSAGTGTIGNAAATTLDGGVFLDLHGTTQYNADTTNFLTIKNNSTLIVENGAQFNMPGSSLIGSDGSLLAAFNNQGVVNSSGAAVEIDAHFNQSGLAGAALNVTAGTLSLKGGGSSNGPLNVSSGATLAFTGGVFGVSVGTTFPGAGTLQVSGSGNLSVNTPMNVPLFDLLAGTLSGGSNTAVTNTMNWSGGTMTGTGVTSIPSGSLVINTVSGALTLDRPLSIAAGANATWTLGANNLNVSTNGSISTSTGAFNIQTNAATLTGAGAAAFTNNGQINRTVGSGTVSLNIPVSGSGTVTASSGVLQFGGNATIGGVVTANAGGGIAFFGASTALTSSVTGGGTIAFDAGSATISGTYNVTGTTKISDATAAFNGPSATTQALLITGTVGPSGGGTLSGTGPFVVNGPFTFSMGHITGAGSFAIAASSVLTVDGAVGFTDLNGRTLTNSGSIIYSAGANTFSMLNSAVINNSGILDYSGGSASISGDGSPGLSINNSGTLTRSTAGNATFNEPVTNSGTVGSTNGKLRFLQGFTQSGGTTTVGTSGIDVSTMTINGGILNGSGTITGNLVNSGTVNPGTSPGLITVTGNYTQTSTGILNVELNGTTAGTLYDQLNVSGVATLAGTMNATLGYTPANLDAFNVLTFGSRSGDFATKNLPTFAGGFIQANYVAGPPQALQLVAIVSADVAITSVTDAPDPVNAGSNVTYTINIANNGPGTSSTEGLSITLTGGTIVSASGPIFTCTTTSTSATCNGSALAASATTTVTVVATAGPQAGTASLSATVTTSDSDPNASNNSGSQTTTITPIADVQITKIAGALTAGQNTSYTITVSNSGPSDAAGVSVSDPTPAGLTFVSNSGACTTAFPCSIGPLATGQSVTITATYSVPSSATGSVSNTATVSATTADSNAANNSATATATIGANADVAITKTLSGSMVAGQNASFTVVVTNNGPSTASSVIVSDSTPAGLTFVSNSGACATPYPCSLGALNVGQSATITSTYSVPANASGTINNTATVSASTGDPTPANNSATATATIGANADVAITKTLSGSMVAGQNASFTVVVTNNGPSTASGVIVSDSTPAGLTFVSNNGACATPYPCSLGALNVGQSVTITSTYSVPASATGTINNTATVSASTGDPTPANNSSTATAAVGASADLVVTKTLGGPLVAGQNATFTITVTNNGPSNAAGVSVTDPTPSGMTFVSNSGACTTAFPCSLGTMTPGQSATITSTYAVAPNASGTITNTATVSSTTADATPANNSASASGTVGATADLSITKSGPASALPGQNIAYSITVTNGGPSTASGVTVTDPTPANMTFVSNSGGCTTAFPCSVGTLNVGQTSIITSTYTVSPTASGSIVNTATVSSATGDSNSSNNSATVSTTITVQADLAITKALSGSLVAGQNASYTITVTNNGPATAASVSVNDPTPAGLTFVSNSGACTTAFPCSLGNLNSGQTVTITSTYGVSVSASGSITNTATVSSATGDPNSANNSASATATVTQTADLSVAKTGPTVTSPGSTIIYTITVVNLGPSTAASVQLSDPTPSGLSFLSAGSCAGFPCSLGNLAAGQSVTVQASYTVLQGAPTPIVNVASVSASSPDSNAANNSASVSTGSCPTAAPSIGSPANGATNVPTTGTLTWSSTGAAAYNVYLDAGPNGCSKFIATTVVPSLAYGGLLSGTSYQWRVDALSPGCPAKSSSCASFTTQTGCPSAPPVLLAPLNTTVTGSATFSWTAVTGAVDYKLFVNGNLITTTTSTSFGPLSVGNAPVSWSVTAEFASPCGPLQSAVGNFNGCDPTVSPIPSIVAEAAPGQDLVLSFNNVTGAVSFEADESTTPNFAQGTVNTRSLTSNSTTYKHTVTTTTAFYYRVRAIFSCGAGVNSVVVRAVIVILVPEINPNVPVPVGSTAIVQIPVHVPGFPGQNLPFTASLDPAQSWLKSVTPSSGNLPPEGVDLIVSADPTGMANGTFTGTVIVLVTTPGSGTIANNGVTPVNVPVSISLVTPITPKPAGTPPANALIIPSVGHLDGFNSKWQSDIRVANTSSQSARYQLTFTPDDASKGVKQTIITVDPGVTTALDDIIKTWYGVGVLGENANGVMEIRPAEGSGKGGPSNDVSVSLTAVASSRTYNVASTGTLGQFIPAIAFSNFIGRAADASKVATILGLQQIAQSDAYRTNLGVVEASGQPASVNVSAFDSNGSKLLDFPLDLKGGEQRQLNAFLSQNKITNLADGRLEVKVTGGEGKITTYASVVDNKSGDPLLVSGVPLGQNAFDHFVLAGVADLNTGAAAWRTDARIFNPTTTAQFATLTFYPQNNSGGPQTTSVTINPGEVKKLDNALSSFFGLTNTGGALHVTTASATPLVVTGRTYNLTSNGTFGQFIPAVTSADAVGKNDRALQILQAEDSVRYRTNLGVAEVTGKPATVEVQIFLPDSKISPSTQIPLPANGFIQVPVIQGLGLTNVYNVRISLRVVDGDGKISAYGSVIDQKTQDPTYVPAQ